MTVQPFRLTDAERHACERLFAHMEERIARLSLENENVQLDAAQTAAKRGQIQAFRELLRLGQPPRTEE